MNQTAEVTARPPRRDAHRLREIERCRAEIAAAESLLLAGHCDIEGLCMALADWSAELKILERERK